MSPAPRNLPPFVLRNQIELAGDMLKQKLDSKTTVISYAPPTVKNGNQKLDFSLLEKTAWTRSVTEDSNERKCV